MRHLRCQEGTVRFACRALMYPRCFCAVFEDEFFVTVGAEVDECSGMAYELTAGYHAT